MEARNVNKMSHKILKVVEGSCCKTGLDTSPERYMNKRQQSSLIINYDGTISQMNLEAGSLS